MDTEGFRRVFATSGLTKAELAYIYQVSRQTIYVWNDGESDPTQRGLAARVDKYTTALLKAITKGVLPMSRSISKDVRKQRLLGIAQSLHKLTTPQDLR